MQVLILKPYCKAQSQELYTYRTDPSYPAKQRSNIKLQYDVAWQNILTDICNARYGVYPILERGKLADMQVACGK